MDSIKGKLEVWEQKLKDFKSNVEKELADIHKCKQEIRQLKEEVVDALSKGHFVRDENRLILSAPEIIIGNVNRQGIAESRAGHIVLRGNCIQVEASDRIENRSPRIHSIAEDPGCDGMEHIFRPNSEIVQVANNLLLRSISHTDTLSPRIDMAVQPGLSLLSDGSLHIKAEMACEEEEKNLNQAIQDLTKQQQNLQQQITAAETSIQATNDELKNILDAPSLNASDLLTRANFVDLDEQHQAFNTQSETQYRQLADYYQLLANAAEISLRKKGLEARKKKAGERKAQFKESSTEAKLNLVAEKISVATRDGDNNIRTNAEAAISFCTPKFSVETTDEHGKLLENSSIFLRTLDATIDTNSQEYTDLAKGDGTCPTIGTVNINAKAFSISSIDFDLKGGALEVKELTPESVFHLQTGKIQLETIDTEGKAVGSVDVNAKQIRLKSIDLDENDAETGIAPESKLQLLSESVFIGSATDELKSKLVQVASDKLKLYGKTWTELQNSEEKGLLRLKGDTVTFSGPKINFWGKSEFMDKVEFASILSGGMETSDLVVNKYFKTPRTKEGAPSGVSTRTDLQKSDQALENPQFQ